MRCTRLYPLKPGCDNIILPKVFLLRGPSAEKKAPNNKNWDKKGKKEKKKFYRKKKGKTHIGKEWYSNYSSSDSGDEELATSTFNKSSLFPNERHTCLMAKEKKVCTCDTPKYTSSSNEEFDDDVDYSNL
jgi:hypothetical protein